jgi:hypothetical protein
MPTRRIATLVESMCPDVTVYLGKWKLYDLVAANLQKGI